jgi:hypothetical protein
MDPLAYLTTQTTNFGTLEWVFFIAQIAVAIAGIYLAFLRADVNPLRRALLQRLGQALLVVGALGTLAGALRLAAVEAFTMPIWFTVVTVLEIILIAYVLYYALSVYPARHAALLAETSRNKGARRSTARPQPALHSNTTNGASYAEPRPIASTTRREARRDRKRKGR